METATKILKHKPGLVSKNRRIDQLLSDEQLTDPLMGNYTIVQTDNIMAAFEGANNQVMLTALTTAPGENADGQETAVNVSAGTSLFMGDQNPGKTVAMTAADFNGDGKAETAVVYIQDNQQLYLQIISTDAAITTFSPTAALNLGQTNNTSVWAGYFQPGPQASLIVSWVDPQGIIQLWISTFAEDLTPQSPVLLQGPGIAGEGLFSIATGVFTGQGNNELAILHQCEPDTNGNNLHLTLYSFTGNSLQIVSNVSAGTYGGTNTCVNLAAGSFLGQSIQDGLATSWSLDGNSMQLKMWSYDTTNNTFNETASNSYPSQFALNRLTTGDLNNDGVEELVVGTVESTDQVPYHMALRVFSFNQSLTLGTPSVAYIYGDDSFNFVNIDFKLSIGNLSGNVGTGIVIAAMGTDNNFFGQDGYARTSFGVIQVDPSLQFSPTYANAQQPGQLAGLYSQELAYSSTKQLNINIGLCLGDFSGESIRVGKPKNYTFEEVQSVIAVVNGLPLSDGLKDAGFSTQTSFDQSKSKETSLGLRTQRTFTTSDSLNVNLGTLITGLNHSMVNTYGQGFSKSTEAFTELFQNLNVTSNDNEDILLLNVNTLYAWEYPVYSKTGTVQGYLLVIFPQNSGGTIKTSSGMDLNSFYNPRHLPGNMLSYSMYPPTDFNTNNGNLSNVEFTTTGLQESFSINYSTNQNTSFEQSSSQDLNISNGISGNIPPDFIEGFSFGINYETRDTYTQSKTSVYSVEFTKSTSIQIQLLPNTVIDPPKIQAMAYNIQPYVYWSQPGGYLKMDYLITIPDTSSAFQQFNTPNPSFHMPWENTPAVKQPLAFDYTEYTRDLNFTVNKDNQDMMDVTVTVHNDTLAETDVINVAIYQGDPRTAGAVLLGNNSIQPIGIRNMGSAFFSQVLPTPTTDTQTSVQIFAVINPDTSLKGDQQHKIAFGIFPSSFLSM
nr:hypothetical protein [uncultured Chitinophaga sp.]